MTSGREIARRVLRRIEQGDAYATLALAGELARAKSDTREAALATELVYGVLRHDRRLDRALSAYAPRGLGKPSTKVALEVAAYQLLFLRVPAHAAVDDAVESVKQAGDAKLAAFANAVLRKVAANGEPPLPADAAARAAIEHPEWLLLRIAAVLGDAETPAAAEALNVAAPTSLRVSLARAKRDDVLAAIRQERPEAELSAGALDETIVARRLGNPETLTVFQQGLVTVQDVAAQRVGRLAAVQPGERVLDACAGVGGKSTHLAQLGAVVDAMDLSRRKLDLAEDTARRLGVTIATREADLTQAKLDDYDRVVLDAPCSGLGVLRRHPEARRREPEVGVLAALQRKLLEHVAPHARRALVYSVCTFTDEEGPAQLAGFLARHPEFVLDEQLSTWPHRDGADGFFAARLRRI